MALDVTDRAALEAAIRSVNPTHVINLAGIAAPTTANTYPDEAWRVHLHGTLDLARVILQRAPDYWLIHVGSGMVYGGSAKAGRALDENALLDPLDEYSATKAAADLALGALIRSGLKCIRLRPFNHTGPGQSEAFVVPAFAVQIARIEAQLAPPVIRVGNLDAQRDFLDVRDVANAYALVMRNLERLESGTVLNIASGIPRRISDILAGLVARSRVEISIEQNPARQRPGDLPIMVGDAGRARGLLHWKPEHSFEDTLTAVLNDCRVRAIQ
jgi:GDP-4-dehydro-6-deoxy-D-mannose reductase